MKNLIKILILTFSFSALAVDLECTGSEVSVSVTGTTLTISGDFEGVAKGIDVFGGNNSTKNVNITKAPAGINPKKITRVAFVNQDEDSILDIYVKKRRTSYDVSCE